MSQIGKPDKKITVAPMKEPVPSREPVPTPAPEQPVKEPA